MYKRQLKQQLVPGGTTGAIIGILDLRGHIIGVVLGVFCRPLGLVTVGVDHFHAVLAVSYTHLDVYKRQGLTLVAQMIDAFRALEVGAVGTGLVNHLAQQLGVFQHGAGAQMVLVEGLAVVVGHEPVSYTHLLLIVSVVI